MIEQAEIDRIKQTVDLAALVRAAGVTLKRKGKQLIGLCPFHDDRSPSLIVDPQKNLWNCLGACGAGGDVYAWVMRREGVDFRAAHQWLMRSAECGVRSEENEAVPSASDLPWLERAVAHYHRCLLETPQAQDYLTARGLTAPELAVTFRVGYADGSLLKILSDEGRAALQRLGVLTEGGRELMQGCVVFPLLDAASGQVVNLYGRHVERAQHLYLPGARRGVFNAAGARNVEEIVVTESVIDAAAVWSAGVRNVQCVYGVHGLTDELIQHWQECRVARVVLLLDSDDAGRQAAPLMEQRLKEKQITARAVWPPAKDASAWLTTGGGGGAALQALLHPADSTATTEPENKFQLIKNADGALNAAVQGRAYRVRGLSPVGLDRLKVNLRVSVGETFHLDTIDLYQARARANFAQTAAKLCRVDEAFIAADLLALLEPLETERLALKQSDKHDDVAMTPQEREAALEFLRAPDLCERIVADFGRCGLEGERATVLTAYLAALSRKLPEPLGALIIARSGAGKSMLQDTVCGFVPPEDLVRVTRLTGQALFYKDPDSLTHKLLAIAEDEGAAQAVYSLRTLASDQHLSIAATRTDPQTGKLQTEHYEVHGPVSIMLTTTSPEAFDEETRSRFVPLALDESVAQTQLILARQRHKYSLAGVLAQATADGVRRLHHAAQRLLRPLRVVNPYAEALRWPAERLIQRREQKKYLALINTIALLHQHQREVKRAATDQLEIEYVEVTLADLRLAHELTQATLSRALDELAPPVRGLYQEIRKLCEERAATQHCTPDEIQLTRRELREATGWSDWQVRVYCQQLVELEYLAVTSGANGKRFCYELAWYEAQEAPRPLLDGLADVAQLERQLKEKDDSALRTPHSALA
jgi:DNA primase catalytic core